MDRPSSDRCDRASLDRLPDACVERVVAALCPAVWRANARLASRRLQAAVDAQLHFAPLGLRPATDPAGLPEPAVLSARFRHAAQLLRHAPPGEPLPQLLRRLEALPDGAWPLVTSASRFTAGRRQADVELLRQVARLCPNLESLALKLVPTTGAQAHEKAAQAASGRGGGAWTCPDDFLAAVCGALRAMPKLQALDVDCTTLWYWHAGGAGATGVPLLWGALERVPHLTRLRVSHKRAAQGVDLAKLPGLRDLDLHRANSNGGELPCIDALRNVSAPLAGMTRLALHY